MYLNKKTFSKCCDYKPIALGINNNNNKLNFNISDSDFIKIQNVQKLNLINKQPIILFKNQKYKSYKLENKIKKNSKNLFRSPNSTKNKNFKNNERKNLFNSPNASKNKREIQINYSNNIWKLNIRPKSTEIKENDNKIIDFSRHKNKLDIKRKKDNLKQYNTSLENKNKEENKDKDYNNKEGDKDKKSEENKSLKKNKKNLISENKIMAEIGHQNFDKLFKRPKSTKTQKNKNKLINYFQNIKIIENKNKIDNHRIKEHFEENNLSNKDNKNKEQTKNYNNEENIKEKNLENNKHIKENEINNEKKEHNIINGILNAKIDLSYTKYKQIMNNLDEQIKFFNYIKTLINSNFKIPKEDIIINNFHGENYKIIFDINFANNEIEKHHIQFINNISELIYIKENFIKKEFLKNKKLEKEFDETLDNMDGGWGQKKIIGGKDYDPPKGYFGIGLNIEKFGKDKTWIGTCNAKGEWPIAYHGVGARCVYSKVKSIIKNNLDPGKTSYYGTGVYFGREIKVADEYAKACQDFNEYYIVFMCRVNPEKLKIVRKNPEYWLLPGNGKGEYIRPYRLLVKEIN